MIRSERESAEVSYLSNPLEFLNAVFSNRKLLAGLIKRDFKGRYAGSVLGIVWAFLQPLAMMIILWAVFTFGLKSGKSQEGAPFVAWFFTAMIAWNFFSDALLQSSNTLHEYAFLVRKIRFQVELLPLVKIASSLILHLVFLLILAVILLIQGIYPSWYWLQVIYYLFGCSLLLMGLGWITSSLSVFLKDVGQIVGIIVQFGFWVTPVIWDPNHLPPKFAGLLKLNPMFYVVEGYRNSLVREKGLWELGLDWTLYFWLFSLLTFFLGLFLFKKLRPHFADVL